MKHPLTYFRLALVAVGLAVGPHLTAADSPELVEARANLLESFQRGRTDNDNEVKQLRAKITALEYVAANKSARVLEQSARLISVDFPGGPASALFNTINKDVNSGLNIIGEKTDLTIDLPPFSIRNADGQSLASALDTLLRQRSYTLQGGVRPGPGLSPVFVLRKLAPHEVHGGHVLPFQSFQLAHYLGHQSVDDIVGAIRTAWELDPANNASALRLKFHPPTGILLVSGPPQGLGVVQTVLNQLRKSEEPKPKADSTPAPSKR